MSSSRYEACGYDGESDFHSLSVDIATEPPPAESLGTISFVELRNLDPSAGELWCKFEPARKGYITVDVPTGGVDLALYNADLNEVASSTRVGSRQRIDWHAPVSGETYYFCLSGSAGDVDVRLANLVCQEDRVVTVHGTDGDDQFEFTAGANHLIAANGVEYEFDAAVVESVTFDALAGHDAIMITGSSGNETIRLLPGEGTVSGAGLAVNVANTESICVHGGGGIDVGLLHGDPEATDTFRADANAATMSGDGYANQLVACRYVHGYGSTGNQDVALLYDDPDTTDTFEAWPENAMARMTGPEFYNRAKSFRWVHGYSTPGNQDVALLHDHPEQSDTFEAWPEMARIRGLDYYNRVKSFRYVHAWGTPGSNDVALLYDSANNDVFQAWPGMARLYGGGFYNRVKSFDWVHGKSTAGGVDLAQLYGSQANDTLVAAPWFTRLRGEGFCNRAVSFSQVQAHARGGEDDVAKLHDSALLDFLEVESDSVELSNEDLDFAVRAIAFDRAELTAHLKDGSEMETLDVNEDLASAVLDGTGTLRIEGTPGADRVSVIEEGDRITVRMKTGDRQVAQVQRFDKALATDIVFEGYAGDDRLDNATSVPLTAHGGAGNDVLQGGSGDDHLYGGENQDSLYGREGVDRLFGDAGDDYLDGAGLNAPFSYEDLLLGGDGVDVLVGPETSAGLSLASPSSEDYGNVALVADFQGSGWGTANQAAFRHALDIWSQYLVASYEDETITVAAGWSDDTSFKAHSKCTGSSAIQGHLHTPALANHKSGKDLDGEAAECEVEFSTKREDGSERLWYFGTDGNCPADRYDFVSTALHEIGHGLSFWSGTDKDGSLPYDWEYEDQDPWWEDPFGDSEATRRTLYHGYIYDSFLEYDGEGFCGMSDVRRKQASRSGDLFWKGAEGAIHNGGVRPEIYAPSTWDPGSSVDHLAEYGSTGAPHGTELMSPRRGHAEVNHHPSYMEVGMLEDMGWHVRYVDPLDAQQPNDTPSKAVNLGTVSPGNPISHLMDNLTIHDPDDVDWFQFEVVDYHACVEDYLACGHCAWADLYLEEPDGSLTWVSTGSYDSWSSVTISPGVYFVEVHGYNAGEALTEYLFYSLAFDAESVPSPDRFEPQTTPIDLGTVSPGNPIWQDLGILSIDNPGDADGFLFSVADSNAWGEISLKFDHSRGDIDVWVFHETSPGDWGAFAYCDSRSDDESIEDTFEPGNYLLLIGFYDGPVEGNFYSLTIDMESL